MEALDSGGEGEEGAEGLDGGAGCFSSLCPFFLDSDG